MTDLEFIKLKQPRISWDNQNYLMKLYFYIEEGYLQSCIYFSYDKFVYYYNQCKGNFKLVDSSYYDKQGNKHLSYFEFARNILGNEADYEIVEIFGLIVKYYKLSPSICLNAIHQRKSQSRKIVLEPKKSMFDKLLLGKSNMGGARKSGEVGNYKEPDKDRMQTLNWLIQDCVKKSASEFTLQYFEEYKQLCLQWEVAAGIRKGLGSYISSKKEKALLKKYKQEVELLQNH